MTALTQSRLKQLLRYDPQTGCFTRVVARPGWRPGSTAGRVNHDGYHQIVVDGRRYSSHRLAFLYMTGEFPCGEVDHINRDRSDNRWVNLRDVSHASNLRNTRLRSDNSSGLVGVRWVPRQGKWHARIKINGQFLHLGSFANLLDAACVRISTQNTLGFDPDHGRG